MLGALIQLFLSWLLPPSAALAPVALLATYSIFTTMMQTATSPRDALMRRVLLGRTSAQLPSETGYFGKEPSAYPLVVFHFGVRINHALGVLAPGVKQTMDHFTACNDLVVQRAREYGMLGLSPWRAGERGSSNTLTMVY